MEGQTRYLQLCVLTSIGQSTTLFLLDGPFNRCESPWPQQKSPITFLPARKHSNGMQWKLTHVVRWFSRLLWAGLLIFRGFPWISRIFLRVPWGSPAALWDHDSGSLSGVCFVVSQSQHVKSPVVTSKQLTLDRNISTMAFQSAYCIYESVLSTGYITGVSCQLSPQCDHHAKKKGRGDSTTKTRSL